MDHILSVAGSESAQAILVLSLVILSGLLLGQIKIFGVQLGTAGILFTGIVFGHFKVTIDPQLQDFLREFGLILFIYALGLYVGPGFFMSLKKAGLKLNLLAVYIVLSGTAITIIYIMSGLVPVAAGAGLLSGAGTNTPSLGAIQEAIAMAGNFPDEIKRMPVLGYAMAYPFGITGIILTMLIIKAVFRIDAEKQATLFEAELTGQRKPIVGANIIIDNPDYAGKRINDLLLHKGLVISRVMHNENIVVASPDTVLNLNDTIHVVGELNNIKTLQQKLGQFSPIDLRTDVPSDIISRWVAVTKPEVTGKSIHEVIMSNLGNLTVTRINRAGVEFPAESDIALQLGDTLLVVGSSAHINQFIATVGDSIHDLRRPNLIPVFIGIILGVFLGNVPIPMISAPVKLGIAGGPLLAAIFLSKIGRIGPINWFMAQSANWMLRELGISVFLACVGLRCGDQFIHTLINGEGVLWMLLGISITLVPLLSAALIGHRWLKLNYLTLCGVLAASSTNPPALAFASNQAKSNAASLGYVTVYPLVMILRIVLAQVIIILFLK